MKTTSSTKRVQLTFAPTIYLNFEVSEDQFAELTEIHDLSEFSDIEFLKSQFWDNALELTVDINAPMTFESINDLKWHINHFKFLFQFSRSKSNAKN